jgi:hypothetical protein
VASPEWTVKRHLEAGGERGRELWHEFAAVVAACGEHSLSVAKTTITFKGPRRGFAASPYQRDLFVHHFRVAAIDDDVRRWIRDAYEQVGCGRRDSVARR